jgi:hypothetical protein
LKAGEYNNEQLWVQGWGTHENGEIFRRRRRRINGKATFLFERFVSLTSKENVASLVL